MSEAGMPMGAQPQMPAMPPMQQTVHDVTVSITRKYGCARVENVPPEEFGITRRHRSVILRDCDYCYHEVRRTQASLIADGYDEEQIKRLPSYSASDNSQEETARDTVDESQSGEDDSLNKSTRPIKVTEHYALLDYEGNGKPRIYRITTGGAGEVLKRKGKPEIVPDRIRFAAITPYIMTHRFFGRSVADLVMDIQRINTALTRALLDNAYLANNQRMEVSESHATKDTLDDLLSGRIGGIVRTKQPGGLNVLQSQSIGNFAFPLLQHMEAKREDRTGVSRQGQGLDPEALQNVGQKAILDASDARKAKTKLIARIFADTGIREMFWLLHGTIRENATEADTVKLRNGWVPVDPREWQQRDDLTINVGLGGGSREHEIQFLMMVLGLQKELVASPQMNMVKPENIFATLKQLTRKGGLKSVEPYFSDPTKEPPPPPQPSPEEQKAQAELQLQKQKQEGDMMMEAEKTKQKAASDQQQMQADFILQQQKMQADLELKRQQIIAEIELKRQQLIAELGLKRELGMASAMNDAVNGVHVGGEPG